MGTSWIASRTESFDSSGIRKVFDLASQMKDPVNLSIGQPDFDVPEAIKLACTQAIHEGKNGYALTQGMPVLRDKLQAKLEEKYRHSDRKVFVSSGTSGGLVLAMLAMVNPGDEVIIFDPYFVMYEPLIKLVGGIPVVIDTHPDFKIDLNKVDAAINDKTKMIIFNSPANPTGVTASEEEIKGLAFLSAKNDVALISDEIYSEFNYDGPFRSPAEFNARTIVIDGFSKSHGMTGWRVGYVHGPAEVIDTMIKLQQYSFVCAPQPAQWACAAAMDFDVSELMAAYKEKRNRLLEGISGCYEIVQPGGAFYVYPKAPHGSGSRFVSLAIENNLLIIPGNIFSRHDSHFRVSYAARDETIDRGIDILRKLAKS